jgi:ATP-dependent Clp protease ATP-binding subunit ClpA
MFISDIENTVIIMTSNAGSDSKAGSYGFTTERNKTLKMRSDTALKELFRPEFLNRVDEVVQFNELEHDSLVEIAGLMLSELKFGLSEREITAGFEDSLKEYIVEKGFDIKYGARPMRRLIKKEVEGLIAEAIITGKINSGDNITVGYKEDKVYMITAKGV